MRDLKDRTREYSLRIIKLFAALPRARVAQIVGEQLLRSGTSVGANYREGIRARSPREYCTKLNISLMELEETLYWLELLEGSEIFPAARLEALKKETDELMAILVTMVRRASKSVKSPR